MAVRLHIKICEAKDVIKMDVGGKSDPYITLRLKSQDKKERQKTQVISNTRNPIWNQEFDITAQDPNDTLLIDMYDEDLKNDDKMMDQLQYPVSTWQIGAPADRKELDIKLKKKKAGKLIFEVQAFPAETYHEQARDIQVEQSYNPQRGHLKIHVYDGKKLKKMDAVGKSDPYMSFELKDRKKSKIKTQIISNTLDPIWNQDLILDVPDVKKDVLVVNLWDEDIKNDDRMMNEQEIPLSSVPIGQKQEFNEGIKLKKKDAGTLHYEYTLCDGPAPTGQDFKPCKLRVTVLKAEKLKKMDANASDPYVTLQLNKEKESLQKTKAIQNDLNPVWNEKFEFSCKDWNTDKLYVNMWDEDIKNDDKMMNELEYPLSQWPIGTDMQVTENLKLKKKDAGILYLGIEVLDVDGQPAVKTRDIVLEEPNGSYCEFSLGNFPSDYSTNFSGFTVYSESLSPLHSFEEKQHHHHRVQTKEVEEEVKPEKPKEEKKEKKPKEEKKEKKEKKSKKPK